MADKNECVDVCKTLFYNVQTTPEKLSFFKSISRMAVLISMQELEGREIEKTGPGAPHGCWYELDAWWAFAGGRQKWQTDITCVRSTERVAARTVCGLCRVCGWCCRWCHRTGLVRSDFGAGRSGRRCRCAGRPCTAPGRIDTKQACRKHVNSGLSKNIEHTCAIFNSRHWTNSRGGAYARRWLRKSLTHSARKKQMEIIALSKNVFVTNVPVRI